MNQNPMQGQQPELKFTQTQIDEAQRAESAEMERHTNGYLQHRVVILRAEINELEKTLAHLQTQQARSEARAAEEENGHG